MESRGSPHNPLWYCTLYWTQEQRVLELHFVIKVALEAIWRFLGRGDAIYLVHFYYCSGASGKCWFRTWKVKYRNRNTKARGKVPLSTYCLTDSKGDIYKWCEAWPWELGLPLASKISLQEATTTSTCVSLTLSFSCIFSMAWWV